VESLASETVGDISEELVERLLSSGLEDVITIYSDVEIIPPSTSELSQAQSPISCTPSGKDLGPGSSQMQMPL
jgi:hypothetical protein